jgi:hypothetical protein
MRYYCCPVKVIIYTSVSPDFVERRILFFDKLRNGAR